MPNCSNCGQPIDKLPNWLDDVDITFRCAVCAEATAHTPIAPVDDEEESPKAAPDTGDDEEIEEDEPEDDEE